MNHEYLETRFATLLSHPACCLATVMPLLSHLGDRASGPDYELRIVEGRTAGVGTLGDAWLREEKAPVWYRWMLSPAILKDGCKSRGGVNLQEGSFHSGCNGMQREMGLGLACFPSFKPSYASR